MSNIRVLGSISLAILAFTFHPSSVAAQDTAPVPPSNAEPEGVDAKAQPRIETPPPSSGLLKRSRAALLLGYGVPSGELVDGSAMTDNISGMLHLQGELDYDLLPQLSVGVYLGLGFGLLSDAYDDTCSADGASCGALGARVGVLAEMRLLPDSPLNPWLNAGVGIEGLSRTINTSYGDATFSAAGPEAALTAGVDLGSRRLAFSPFVSYRVGSYSRTEYESNGYVLAEGEIEDTAAHRWLMFGVRGTFAGR